MKPRPARRCPRRITPRDAQMQTRGPSGEHFAGSEARRSSIPDLCSEMDNRRSQRGRHLSLRLTQTRRAFTDSHHGRFTDSHHGRAEGVSLVWTECDSSKEGGESIMKRTTESLRVENLPVREERHRGVGKCQPHIFFPPPPEFGAERRSYDLGQYKFVVRSWLETRNTLVSSLVFDHRRPCSRRCFFLDVFGQMA